MPKSSKTTRRPACISTKCVIEGAPCAWKTRTLVIGAEVTSADEFHALHSAGWKWILRRDDHLELLHLQAWYFQIRHFPRLSWVRLQPPDREYFITSDRSAAWLADGYADTPSAALRHPNAQVAAPLTRKTALVGRHGAAALSVTPREINRFIPFAASGWIDGPTADVVRKALIDRRDPRHCVRRHFQERAMA